LRETKRGRVAETARETIKTAEGRTGRRFDADADVPTLLFYPISGGVKGGPGAFFERRRAKKRRRSVGGARVWPDVWRSGVGGRVDRRLEGKRRFSDVGGGVASRPGEGAAIFSAFFSSSSSSSSSSFRLLSVALGGILTFEAFRGAASGTLVQRSA